MKKSRSPRKFDDIVDDIYSIYGMKRAHEEHHALKVWHTVVGETIARITEVEKFVKGVLYVRVLNPSWRNELSFMKKNIVGRLNETIGKVMVKDIVFK
ncbi:MULTISPECIES: DUF721 domain-containing protein [Prosthecochloris]|uniref:DUF721 domain-containing protein n=1 Tax=Prosthecochloris marina TaxID=2017681 RepID=A0A317T3U1_9CHLB|nr:MULTISPECIES: DUF721 domain-containing protein [Prosthecochloris]PWW81293.1 hypothetical protein CR164_11170 [Prosthecochloris marina]UZJ37633.1 DUF721 domain-containing protein [Prosthecochloris sp. SCSIO W1103]UZJ39452.1 DUF721 domain-containing protein [Prosthecochloris sp. SCSIO W1102]